MSMLVVVVRESTGGEAGGDDEYRKHGACDRSSRPHSPSATRDRSVQSCS